MFAFSKLTMLINHIIENMRFKDNRGNIEMLITYILYYSIDNSSYEVRM